MKRIFKKQRTKNMMVSGSGAGTFRDRGSNQRADTTTSNPYFQNNFLGRLQEYTRWYMTAWEARKIIDIPVQDALRIPVELKGMDHLDAEILRKEYDRLKLDKQLQRALVQERLLGGCVLLGIFERDSNEETNTLLKLSTIKKGDLKSVNVVDVTRLSRSFTDADPFSPDYDNNGTLLISGTEVHESRMCVLDGNALFSRSTQMVLEMGRFNPCGFGESKLAPLYDTLIRVVGTQQGAYHLVNLASCLVMSTEKLTSLSGSNTPSLDKLQDIVNQLSIYRGAIIDGKGMEFKQHASSFGSVPELVMSFLQILSAGSDIPATRFLGQAPGGLNATGISDLENYYNSIASWQQSNIKHIHKRLFEWVGCSLWGYEGWRIKTKNFDLEYPPLWNLDKVQQSQVDTSYATILGQLVQSGLLTTEQAMEELNSRGIFTTELELEADPLSGGNEFEDFGDRSALEAILKGSENANLPIK